MLNGFLKFVAGKWTNTTVSSSNPLPSELFLRRNGLPQTPSFTNPIYTTTGGGASLLPSCLQEAGFICHGATVAAGGSGKLSKQQLFNPVDSGKTIVIYQVLVWHTTGTITYKASYNSAAISATEVVETKQNILAGSSNTASAKIFTDNTSATSATTIVSSIPVSATAPNGSNTIAWGQCVIKEGQGLLVESTTANQPMNAMWLWAEVSNT